MINTPENWNVLATLIAAMLGGGITAYFAVHQLQATKRQVAVGTTQIYLDLEMASVELFRFEAAYKEAVARFEGPDAVDLNAVSGEESVLLTAYITQFLNLFELATAFRKDGTFPPKVFATWVAWMYETCSSATFQANWEVEFRGHYSEELAAILDMGVNLLSESSPEQDKARKHVFYNHVAQMFGNCRFIKAWADR